MTLAAERQHIVAAVRQAAQLTRRVRATLVVAAQKAGREPVTVADFGAQAILCRAIREYLPTDAVLAEERASDFLSAATPEQRQQTAQFVGDMLGEPVTEGMICAWLDHGRDVSAARRWVIDPIDGTTGFLAGRRYTIAVGLLVDGAPIFSVMGCPAYPHAAGLGLIFYAEQGGGAYLLAMDDASAESLSVRVSPQPDPALARGVESVESGHADHAGLARIREALGARGVVRLDGQDKYAAVACGDAEYYLRLSPDKTRRERAWDHAAGALLVAEAGGAVTDLDGRPLDFSTGARLERNRGIIASNGVLHGRLVEAVRATNV